MGHYVGSMLLEKANGFEGGRRTRALDGAAIKKDDKSSRHQ